MSLLLYLVGGVVIFGLSMGFGLSFFFVSTRELPRFFPLIIVAVIALVIWLVWHFTGSQAFLISSIVLSLLVAWGTHRGSTKDRRMINANAGPGEKTFKVMIDYSLPFSERFKRDTYGKGYSDIGDSRDEITEKNFPIFGTGKSEVEVTIVKFQGNQLTSTVVAELGNRGLVPGRIEHLMALHDLQPDLHLWNQAYIYALASTWVDPKGKTRVAALSTEVPHVMQANYASSSTLPDDWFIAIKK